MAHKNKTNYSPYKARQAAKVVNHPAKHQVKTLDKSSPKAPIARGNEAQKINKTLNVRTGESLLKGTHKKPTEIYSLEEANDRLYDVFKNHEFTLVNHEQRKALAHYYRLLMLNQEKENFTRLLSLKDVAIKHFIDSLIITNYCKLTFPLLDLGTGPGLPGIPLKIIYPNEKILLAEGVQRRVNFLKHCREEMKLENLEIVGKNIYPDFVYPVQGVITRAVEDITNTMNNVMGCLQVGGKIFFMKGPGVAPEIDKATEEMKEFYTLEKDIAYDIPHTPNKRRLVIYKKIKSKDLIDDEDEI
jgi:16S rRNA (guanine527-N7)-methyltransferase